MNSNYLSIGQMARINNTTVPTLRLYDSLGLLTPYYTDPNTHYRYYDIKQSARFDLIQYMKELGMELKEIQAILASEDLHQIETILIQKRLQTLKNIEMLKIQREAIERTIESIERYRKSPSKGTLSLEYIPARKIYSMKTDINFYDHDIDTYEIILKQLKNKLLIHNVPPVYYCNAGTLLKQDDFQNLHFVSNKIFVFVDDHFPLKEDIELIESSMYACIYLDDFNAEQEYAKKLLNYCQSNNYTICGDYICEVLTEFNVFDCQKRSMFLRLQIPVSFNKKY
ncbi:MAG: MerR family transcriptional regulator [Frisingicoccus sp.]|uniref:MerR family transcriptional regulator n=1 Tax=Frisingicoccus sp. TaxID=1918627 RepID=UPI00260FEC56|nr:MerR family transcriptional regulator [Frisingicoccus sp.]MDD6232455.1 MerR family transcriptional regulator [Frisingicoccus sp.]